MKKQMASNVFPFPNRYPLYFRVILKSFNLNIKIVFGLILAVFKFCLNTPSPPLIYLTYLNIAINDWAARCRSPLSSWRQQVCKPRQPLWFCVIFYYLDAIYHFGSRPNFSRLLIYGFYQEFGRFLRKVTKERCMLGNINQVTPTPVTVCARASRELPFKGPSALAG